MPALCFCGANEWNGNGQYMTLQFPTKPRAVKGGWASSRQISGFLETCNVCRDKAVTNEDGIPLRFIRDSDRIILSH